MNDADRISFRNLGVRLAEMHLLTDDDGITVNKGDLRRIMRALSSSEDYVFTLRSEITGMRAENAMLQRDQS